MISKNPYILLSVINTKLRDNYSNLDDLFDNDSLFSDVSKMEIYEIMKSIDYYYDEKQNQFKQGE